MESMGHVVVPLRVGGKKMKKRRELDALVAHSLAKRACNSGKKQQAGNGINSQDQLLSQSTDDQEDSVTWSKAPISSVRHQTKRYTFVRICGPTVFILSIFILFGFMYWLYFDLRQQIYDHRLKIEQASTATQLLPDALQKWHVATKSLEQNQTAINRKLGEVHNSLQKFEKELSAMKAEIMKKNADSDSEKLSVLQNSVATFGAKIKDLSISLTDFKEQLNNVKQVVSQNQGNYTNLAKELDLITHNYSLSSGFNLDSVQAMVHNVSQNCSVAIENLSTKLDSINDTLSQKSKGLNEDLTSLKPKVDTLADNFANMSSHVMSIEDDWTKYKKNTIDFSQTSMQLNEEILRLKNKTAMLSNTIHIMQAEHLKQENFFNSEAEINTRADNLIRFTQLPILSGEPALRPLMNDMRPPTAMDFAQAAAQTTTFAPLPIILNATILKAIEDNMQSDSKKGV